MVNVSGKRPGPLLELLAETPGPAIGNESMASTRPT